MKYDVIQSKANTKTLRMPHQHEAVESLNRYFNLDDPAGPQSGLLMMPTGSGKTFTAVSWLLNSGPYFKRECGEDGSTIMHVDAFLKFGYFEPYEGTQTLEELLNSSNIDTI
ncbi:MAG: DEAD/DEAH box helicase family protein [Natronincolaceae bacterium]|jgi:hypothetical protein|nr:DEAD/DEAH box helicase family protein [Bacillota bacterium]